MRFWRLSQAVLSAALLLGMSGLPAVPQSLDGLRGGTPLDVVPEPPPLARPVTDDRRQPRAYPEQPPVIPHNIEGYELTLRANRCLTCHSRQFTGQSQAPMISVTHFMDRDGQVLATVSARRYFCTSCHVPQTQVQLPVESTFLDVDQILDQTRRQRGP